MAAHQDATRYNSRSHDDQFINLLQRYYEYDANRNIPKNDLLSRICREVGILSVSIATHRGRFEELVANAFPYVLRDMLQVTDPSGSVVFYRLRERTLRNPLPYDRGEHDQLILTHLKSRCRFKENANISNHLLRNRIADPLSIQADTIPLGPFGKLVHKAFKDFKSNLTKRYADDRTFQGTYYQLEHTPQEDDEEDDEEEQLDSDDDDRSIASMDDLFHRNVQNDDEHEVDEQQPQAPGWLFDGRFEDMVLRIVHMVIELLREHRLIGENPPNYEDLFRDQ